MPTEEINITIIILIILLKYKVIVSPQDNILCLKYFHDLFAIKSNITYLSFFDGVNINGIKKETSNKVKLKHQPRQT